MIRLPTNRAPSHPGEILREEFLIPMGTTQSELAHLLKIRSAIRGHPRANASLAIRAAVALGGFPRKRCALAEFSATNDDPPLRPRSS